MAGRRFLLMHVTTSSGHHHASRAIAHTVARVDPTAQLTAIDAFQFISPAVRWAMSRTYHSLIRHYPDVWEYLYDNPNVHRRVRNLRLLLHRYQAGKLRKLLDEVQPDVIVCTQAFPCGMAADYKRHHGLTIPLVGILTDHAPHLYWFHDAVDTYVVPSEQVKRRFLQRGVAEARIKVLGIPLELKFLEPGDPQAAARQFELDLRRPIILIMGGGSGFGPLRLIIEHLDALPHACQLVVLTGTNRALQHWVSRQRFQHRVLALEYTDAVPSLMAVATMLISKPGGLTTSEALAKQLPLVIVNPIPGQEAYNARFLLSHGAAVQAGSPTMVRQTVRDLLDNPERLTMLRRRIAELARPNASLDIAALLFELADRSKSGEAVGVGQAVE